MSFRQLCEDPQVRGIIQRRLEAVFETDEQDQSQGHADSNVRMAPTSATITEQQSRKSRRRSHLQSSLNFNNAFPELALSPSAESQQSEFPRHQNQSQAVDAEETFVSQYDDAVEYREDEEDKRSPPEVAPRSLEELCSDDHKRKGWSEIRQWRRI
ncbi:uncharacterized protein K441DRAFT_674833 [Cenococcum geophilum 1.58]|uniref:uncharacterized protein n=1 Tax=Cenococcum geophilum 1.58 TaxID=794803 RepID=UPI00358F8B19|nr:hypothetical protein K441DRAFT_674833 [Cenococcum geophilum 1.58]